MTTEAVVVFGLVALLTALAAMLWRVGRARDMALKSSKRAERLQQQSEWDRMVEKGRNRA